MLDIKSAGKGKVEFSRPTDEGRNASEWSQWEDTSAGTGWALVVKGVNEASSGVTSSVRSGGVELG